MVTKQYADARDALDCSRIPNPVVCGGGTPLFSDSERLGADHRGFWRHVGGNPRLVQCQVLAVVVAVFVSLLAGIVGRSLRAPYVAAAAGISRPFSLRRCWRL